MKTTIRSIAIAALLLQSLTVIAGTESDWAVRNVHVVSFEHYWKLNASVLRVFYKINPDSVVPDESFNCTVNTMPAVEGKNLYQATYWVGGVNAHHQVQLSVLMFAQAQNLPIDLMFDATGCNTNDLYGYGGLGRKFLGVRLSIGS